jgi:methyl-accepting chemotaxis protein
MAAALVDKAENYLRIRLYHVTGIAAADKAALLPVVRETAAEAARANALHLQGIAKVHTAAIEKNFDELVRWAESATLALFAQPFDDVWLDNCEKRARSEHAMGIDFRYRAALITTLLMHMSKAIGRRWMWNGVRAAHLFSVAHRILQMDSAVATTYHNAIAREAVAQESEARTRDLQTFQRRVEDVRKTIGDVANAMDQTSQSLGAMSSTGAGLVDDAYRSADEVARNINRSASATEELSAAIAAIGQQAAQSSELAQKAVDATARGNEAMESLHRAVDSIGSMVELISQIAAQTNMLALNATIEAARAGDAGRGFAVVAAEVKTLAKQTSQATQHIGSLIQQIQAATQSSVDSAAVSGTMVSEIAAITLTVSTSVQEQSLTTREIARSGTEILSHATRVANAMRTANGSMRETLDTAERMGKLSRDLLDRSRDLDAAADMITKAASTATPKIRALDVTR